MDFKKGAMNAVESKFKCQLYACFFHLSQSLYRRVQRSGILKDFALNDKCSYTFKLIQALAFLPVKDVIPEQCPKSFEPILAYFERVYIGKLKLNSKSQRKVAQFPIETWNVFERVIKRLPRTNNNVENWHGRIQADSRYNESYYYAQLQCLTLNLRTVIS
ncbi:hypothetical protein BpHYR1_039054 [Brachionus plicatilis]|uniref:MULE transposase domain-containing protein n=1 Tax=Brachionus plicatilis TaxID=10195 RepID=A0A3M7S3L3_BRAPC|nr:hypothetical protein BpHYR1_039054 [Brachionus plicatilis]